MVRIEATAEASLAAIRERSRLGIAIAAMIKMIATTMSNSINEKPFCLLRIGIESLLVVKCQSTPSDGHVWRQAYFQCGCLLLFLRITLVLKGLTGPRTIRVRGNPKRKGLRHKKSTISVTQKRQFTAGLINLEERLASDHVSNRAEFAAVWQC